MTRSKSVSIGGGESYGAVFACTEKSQTECIKKSLFGAGKIHEDKVLDVKKGDILFLHNKDTDTLQGPYTALCNGKKNIDAKAWRGMYPYQVKAKRYNGKVFTANNFTETSELLKLDWKNTIITDRQINILLNFLQNKSLTADDVKECLKLNQDNSRNKKPILESTTLWDYPKQSYGTKKKGRAIAEKDTDGTYVLTERNLEVSNNVKMFESLIDDIEKYVLPKEMH